MLKVKPPLDGCSEERHGDRNTLTFVLHYDVMGGILVYKHYY